MTEMTGGEAVVRMFQTYGVEYGFGMGGFQPLPYYDALSRQDSMRHILIRDEKHGSFAADAYARVANRPAAADATVGPGATNLVSGAAESFGASIPQILLTADINRAITTRGATQESDQIGMLRPTSRDTVEIERIERIPELIRRAFTSANTGRPGPAHINIPENVFHGRHDFADDVFYATPGTDRAGGLRIAPDPDAINAAARIIAKAERPVILAGGGIHLSRAYESLERLASTAGAPVATSISGKGAISESHPLSLGLVGRYSRYGNDFIGRADVLIVVGCKLGEIATNRWSIIEPHTTVVHIDVDPHELGRVYRTDAPVWADAHLGLSALADTLTANEKRRKERVGEVAEARAAWYREAEPKYLADDQPIPMARVLHELGSAAPEDALIVADGGFAAHWSALLYNINQTGRTYIANRGHAAIGYGLPGGMGAKLAAPDRPVIALCGDNGFAMAIAELETAKRAGAAVVCLVVNNRALGYVKALQHGMYEDRFLSVDFLDVDYAEAARAFGCEGVRVHTAEQLNKSLTEAMEADVPYVIDCLITDDPSEMLPGIDSRTTGS